MSSSPAATPLATASPVSQASPLVMRVIGACALAHLINDLIQAVLPAIYPMLKLNYGLSFAQIGLITLTFQLTASLLQPWIGYHTDRHPKPWLLPAGMVQTTPVLPAITLGNGEVVTGVDIGDFLLISISAIRSPHLWITVTDQEKTTTVL